MKNTIIKVSAIIAAVVFSASCIKESVPVASAVITMMLMFLVLSLVFLFIIPLINREIILFRQIYKRF